MVIFGFLETELMIIEDLKEKKMRKEMLGLKMRQNSCLVKRYYIIEQDFLIYEQK